MGWDGENWKIGKLRGRCRCAVCDGWMYLPYVCLLAEEKSRVDLMLVLAISSVAIATAMAGWVNREIK